MKRRYLLWLICMVIALAHFVASWIAFTRSELIRPTEATALWRSVSEILAFPLMYLSDITSVIDLFPILMIANSLLWGGVAYLLAIAALRIYRRTTGAS